MCSGVKIKMQSRCAKNLDFCHRTRLVRSPSQMPEDLGINSRVLPLLVQLWCRFKKVPYSVLHGDVRCKSLPVVLIYVLIEYIEDD